MQAFFIISTAVGWSDIMYQAASIRGLDLAHSSSIESPSSAIFFVFTLILGNFFLMNLFVGVIISTYNREKELSGKDYMLSDNQKKAIDTSLTFLNTQPKHRMKVPKTGWR
jgi:Ion transport protein